MNPCCKAAIKALLTPRPIETAVKSNEDFNHFQLIEDGVTVIEQAYISRGKVSWSDEYYEGTPTHWLPLPEDLIKEVDAL